MIKEDLAIGIDLGTTFCCIGVYIEGKGIEIIPNKANDTTFPSIVTISENGIFACDQAKNYIIKEPNNTIYGIKRIIGLNFKEKSVQNDIKLWPFEVVKSDENDYSMVKINKNGKIEKYYPEEISAIILKRLKAIAEEYLEKKIRYAVITVPAYFTNNQREATKKAGKLAGLEVLRIINEPTAAALAYGLDKKYGKLKQTTILNDFLKLEQNNDDCETLLEDKEDLNEKNILVFDLGGGTFDVSLVNIVNNEKFEVKYTSGNTHLGGEDFDQKLVDYCVQDFLLKNKEITEEAIKNNKKGLKRLKVACEKSKRLLSITQEILINVDNFYQDESLSVNITRAKFENECINIFAQLSKPIDEVIKKANIGVSDINEVVLVGGSTRIPKIKELIAEYFGGIKINDTINPDEAVAYGAAIDAYKIHSKKKDILNNIVLLDTTPFSLGLGVGDNYQLIIPKGSTIPTKITNMGITEWDNQYNVELPIYEGEYSDVRKNHFLGKFEITDIPMKKAGEIIFEVTYQVDVDGILTVTAVMQDDPSKKNWKVIKNDNIGLSGNELNERNSIENFDATKMIEEFKDNENLKKRMKKLHKLYEETINFNKKMQYLKNFCKILSEFIDTFNSYSIENDTVFEKFYIYLNSLFESYSVFFSKQQNEDKEFKRNVIEKINNYFKKISKCDSYYLKHLIDKLYGIKEVNYEMFQEIIINLMGILTDRGIEILNSGRKWSKHQAKNVFNDILNISSTYLKEDDIELLEDITLGDKWREYLKKCTESIKKINASAKINLDEDRNSYKLYQKKNGEDEEHLELILDNFRDALSQLENDEQKVDLELEAICLANIAKIKYKFLNHNNKISILEEIKDISYRSLKMGMMSVELEHKNVEYTNWFKEIKEIDQEINDYLLLEEEKAQGGFKLQMKKDNRAIFDELEEVFKKDNYEIITFILTKYPPLDYEYKPDIVKTQWEENKKNLIYNLCTKYAENNYPKQTNEEKLKYTIMSEISTKINSIYNEVK